MTTVKQKWLPQVVADLIRHEGFREFAYPDPLSRLAKVRAKWGYRPAGEILKELNLSASQGKPWTVGYGFTHNVTPDSKITKAAAEKELTKEVEKHLHVVDTLFPEWKAMPLAVQTVLINMAFNMGLNRLSQFKPTIALINSGQYPAAATRLKNTAWYRQVGPRAQELVERMYTQKIQDKHKVT